MFRLAPGIFPQTVHCWGTQFYLKVCPPCVRGCVRLRTICLPIHLSPNSFVSQVLCQGLCPPPGDLSPNSFVSQFIRLPGPVSRAVSAFPGFVSHHLFLKSCVRGCVRLRGICLPIHLSPNSFVSQFICLPGPVSGAVSASGGFVSQFICPPCVRGCVRLRTICLPIHLSPRSLSPNSFVSQFIRLPGPVSRAVSASGGFVSQFICLPGPLSRAVSAFPGFVSHHLFLKSCVRGCVRLRGICLPIHLSPNSFVSQVLCQGLCPPPGDLSPNSFVRLVSGAVSASGRFVSQFICLPGPCLPIHLSPRSCGRGCVRLRGIGFPIHLSPNSFVSQVLCQGLCPPSGDLSPNSFVFHHLCPRSCVRGCVRISAICLPSFVFHHLSPIICLPGPVSGAVSASGGFVSQFMCPPCVRGCVRLRTICLPIHLSPRSLSPNSFVSQVLCQGLCPPPGDLFPNSFVSQVLCQGLCPPFRDLSPIIPQAAYCWGTQFYLKMCPPCVRGCVRLPGLCVSHHLSPILCLPCPVSRAVSTSLGFVSPISPQTVYCWRSQFSFKRCPAMFRWWCLALRMSRIHLSPCGNSVVSQSGWWCPALWLSPIHLSALISTHLFPSLAGGVRLFGCLQFICPPS